jgi:hypothetical protein
VSVILPLWRRPHRVAPVLQAFAEAGGPVEIVPVVSSDDLETIEALVAYEEMFGLARVQMAHWPGGSPGDYARKINAAAGATSTPWIFTGADDLAPQPGWVEAALGPDPTVHTAAVIGTNDLFNPRVLAGTHSTHSLVARWYIENPGGAWGEPGTVFHEGYPHEFCDDELIGVAQSRGRFRCASESIVEHLHPYAGKSPRDDVYDHGHRSNREAQLLFLSRSRGWKPGGRTTNRLRRSR